MGPPPARSDGPPEVLLVEDNPGDVRLVRVALSDGEVDVPLSVVGDGTEALDHLHRRGEYADAPRPDLVLLDLNLPRTTGTEVLEAMQDDPDLARIPVIVLTSSTDPDDVATAYELSANAYLTKPVDPDAFVEAVCAIEGFWLRLVHLPPSTDASSAD